MPSPTCSRLRGRTICHAAVGTFFAALGAVVGFLPEESRANAWINEPDWIIGINDTTDGGVQAIASHDSDLGWWNAGAKETWGTGYIHAPGYSGPWFTGSNTHCIDGAGGNSFDTTYDTPVLKIVVHRSMSAQHEFLESYTFTNTGKADFNMKGDAVGTYDNETDEQIYVDDPPQNHNGADERLAMGALPALYLARNPPTDLAPEIKMSLQAYLAFRLREHQDEVTGQVFNAAGRKGERLYDYPWFIHFHLALYQALGDKIHLQHFVQTCRAFYTHKGATFYPIGMPIIEGLQALQKEGMTVEYKEILADFTSHADNLVANGTSYSNKEVYFEQSIVAPSIQFLLETYLVTHDAKYLTAAKQQMPVLEAFLGQQPDHHLYDVAIRYWDDFWFGKSAVYGDTLPHYWSTITAVTFDSYARATGDQSYASRAQEILRNNWSLHGGRQSIVRVRLPPNGEWKTGIL